MGHRFAHPVDLLERFGIGWRMVEYDKVLGAVVPLGNGYFGMLKRDGERVIRVGSAPTLVAAAERLWSATHAVRWGDVR